MTPSAPAAAGATGRPCSITSEPASRRATRPSTSTMTRSARRATVGSWVTTTSVMPSSRSGGRAARGSGGPERGVEVAGGLVGEQQRAGRITIARAIATRWRSPPESWSGRWSCGRRGRPPRAPPSTRCAPLGARNAREDHRQLDVLAPRSAAAPGGTTGRRSRSGCAARRSAPRRRELATSRPSSTVAAGGRRGRGSR